MNDQHEEVRLAIINNSSTSISLIKLLAKDTNKNISLAAKNKIKK